jgi:hypothetical protein
MMHTACVGILNSDPYVSDQDLFARYPLIIAKPSQTTKPARILPDKSLPRFDRKLFSIRPIWRYVPELISDVNAGPFFASGIGAAREKFRSTPRWFHA